jgi:hypothetical protein
MWHSISPPESKALASRSELHRALAWGIPRPSLDIPRAEVKHVHNPADTLVGDCGHILEFDKKNSRHGGSMTAFCMRANAPGQGKRDCATRS